MLACLVLNSRKSFLKHYPDLSRNGWGNLTPHILLKNKNFKLLSFIISVPDCDLPNGTKYLISHFSKGKKLSFPLNFAFSSIQTNN